MHLYKNSTHLGRVCNFIIYIRTCLGDIDSTYTIFHVMYRTCFVLNCMHMRHRLDSNAVFSRNFSTCMLIIILCV